MPTGIYKRTRKHREKIRKALKGKMPKNIVAGWNKGLLGQENPNWKGGKIIRNGYVLIYSPNHPRKSSQCYVFEHRLVMEKHLGRYLEKWEQIHHKNGIKNDNKIENLELVINKKHFGQIRCPYCLKEFLIK